MERDRYKTVTNKESFAILIPASPEEAMGEATFLCELGQPVPVRAVTGNELRIAGVKMRGVEGDQFFALLALRGALEARDELALAKAKERLEKVYRLREAKWALTQSPEDEESRRHFSEVLATVTGLPADESLKHFEGLRPGLRAKTNPFRLLSYEVSQRVGGANIALWLVDGTFRPAIYCPDTETALYIHTFFIVPTGGLGWRVCPFTHCKTKEFFQKKPNQEYCIPAHREAHRVARFRNKKKLETAKAKTNRRKSSGTQKAR
jgi:hypothetical protein